MILAVGHDIVEINRFAQWHTYSTQTLQRIFDIAEIEYCLQHPAYSAQRFAARFAAKEAAYKAVCSANIFRGHVPFLTAARLIVVVMNNGKPTLMLKPEITIIQPIKWHISISHSSSHASAVVIAEQL